MTPHDSTRCAVCGYVAIPPVCTKCATPLPTEGVGAVEGKAHNGTMRLDPEAFQTAMMEYGWGISADAEDLEAWEAHASRTIAAYLLALRAPVPSGVTADEDRVADLLGDVIVASQDLEHNGHALTPSHEREKNRHAFRIALENYTAALRGGRDA